MAATEISASAVLRKEVVDSTIKGRADAVYKFKQAVTVTSSNAWKNTFFRESDTVLAGGTTSNTKQIPRGAAFPQAKVKWEEISAYVDKYGMEDFVYYEDILMNDLDVLRRTIFRLTEGVVKAVDDEIWDKLSESQSASSIQSISISNGRFWNVSSAAIIDDLMYAKQLIAAKNYDTENLICFISPRDHRSIIKYLTDKGAQFPSIGNDTASNGKVGKLAGINLVMSNSVTTSYALVCVPQVCATWRESVPLQSDLKEDAYKGTRIRVVEMGVTQVTDPNAIVLISGTDDGN